MPFFTGCFLSGPTSCNGRHETTAALLDEEVRRNMRSDARLCLGLPETVSAGLWQRHVAADAVVKSGAWSGIEP